MRVSVGKIDTRIDINQKRYQFIYKKLAAC